MLLSDLQTGDVIPGDNQSDPTIPPPWLDKHKFNRGRQFFQEHFTSALLAMYTSLACGLSVRNLLDPLVFTERSNTPKKAFKRYLSTFKHVVHWHLGDVWDPEDPAFESVQSVRRLHGDIARAMGGNGTIAVSQLDMAFVQSGFMAAIVSYPREFGVKCSESDLECYIHFWRGIGYLLGMDDRYNICGGSYSETKTICLEIERDVVGEGLKNPPEGFKKMARAFVDGSNIPLPVKIFSYDAVVTWVVSIAESYRNKTFSHICEPTVCDKFRVHFYRAFCWVLRTFPCIERKLNQFFIRNWYRHLKIPQL